MKINLIVYLTIPIILIGQAEERWDWVETIPKPWTLTKDEVSELLPEFRQRYPDFHDRLKAFALWRIGTPYEIFKLGEEIDPDPDPIIRLDVSDCTAHILTCMAFVQSEDWDEAKEIMIDIHYKPDEKGDKRPTFQSRWHYTSHRISFHPSTIDITKDLTRRTDLEQVEIVLNEKSDGSEFLDLGWKQHMIMEFLPSENVTAAFLENLPEVCGVAFVKKSYFSQGIVIAHEGMIIDNTDILHASQEKGTTLREDFMSYYFREDGPIFDGMMVYRFEPLE